MGNAWSLYTARCNARGMTIRGARLGREQQYLTTKLPDSLSFHHAIVDGIERDVAIINTDNLNEKFIYSLPGEDIRHGSIVEWMQNHWLVTERDANIEVYTKAKMLQCNFELKWVDENHVIQKRWSIVEDGTKYLTGELFDKMFIVTRGDSRIAVTLPRDEDTAKLNRDTRFIIDDPLSSRPMAYRLTKPMKLGWEFNGDGCLKFVCQEVASTDDDNMDEFIADYYKHFPRPKEEGINPEENKTPDGKDVWL